MDVVEYADYGTLSVGSLLIGLVSRILILISSHSGSGSGSGSSSRPHDIPPLYTYNMTNVACLGESHHTLLVLSLTTLDFRFLTSAFYILL